MTLRPWAVVVAVAWMGVILWLSTADFSAQSTAAWLQPALGWLAPGLSADTTRRLNWGLRTLAHVAEYAILALLWLRALAGGGGRAALPVVCGVLAVCAAWAAVDEAYQARVPVRLGRARDVALDAAGALVAVCAVRTLRRALLPDRRGRSRPGSPAILPAPDCVSGGPRVPTPPAAGPARPVPENSHDQPAGHAGDGRRRPPLLA